MEWLLTPPSERVVRSKSKWGEENGVARRTLYDWERKPSFRAEWESRAKEIQGSPERTQDVLDAMFVLAKQGDVSAAKLWLTAMEKITPPTVRVDQTVTAKRALAELSDADLEALLASEAAVELAKRSEVGL